MYEGSGGPIISWANLTLVFIIVSNSVRETIRTDYEDSIPIKVTHEGLVQWNYPTIIRSSCSLDMTMFPWDVQACDLKFGSWSYNTYAIDITGDK